MNDDLINNIKNITFKFLDPNDYKVFIFGSRALGINRKFSDIDLGIISKTELPTNLKFNLEEAFDDSDLPYKVDIVDFSKVAENFKEVAMKKVIYLN